MNKYIGTKLIEAEPMTKKDFLVKEKNKTKEELHNEDDMHGYKVKYSDQYISWSPKNMFEKAYMKIITNANLKSDISISQEMVDNFIKETHINTIGDKTTLVRAVLRNGFEIVEASACIDKENYDEKVGSEICMDKIKDKVWYLLGFLLQTAKNGIN
ncbi:MAG: hypothetical protein LIR50_03840 [Bacillota bacterium]|nr:hypothetical protein [Bacillota bacterium]